jgi:hypothetical protein
LNIETKESLDNEPYDENSPIETEPDEYQLNQQEQQDASNETNAFYGLKKESHQQNAVRLFDKN